MDAATEILMPSSEDEAIAAFGDGADVVVVGGGTIVVPDADVPAAAAVEGADARDAPGSPGSMKDGSRVTIGATTPVQELHGMAAPIGPCASNVADLEIRSQGTVGGNLCAGEGSEAPRGDLQGAFARASARPRASAARRRASPRSRFEDFLAKRGERLLLERELRRAGRGRVRRPRPARTRTTTRRSRCRVHARQTGRSASRRRERARRAVGSHRPRRAEDRLPRAKQRSSDVTPHDDALASAWYRTKVLPVLVRRVLTELKESA